MHAREVRIVVSPLRFEPEDLRDFAQQLLYRSRRGPDQSRVYDFPAGEHGAHVAMHLQVVLYPDNSLEMLRARRPTGLFYAADK